MIQRKQTFFILISLIISCLIIFSIDLVNSKKYDFTLNVSNEPVLSMFFYGSFLLGLISFFAFKNRLLQYRLCVFNMYFQICPIIFTFSYMSTKNFHPQLFDILGIFLVFISLAFYGMAAIYIKKDEDLIKSIDRI